MVETETFHADIFREIPPCCVKVAHQTFRNLFPETTTRWKK